MAKRLPILVSRITGACLLCIAAMLASSLHAQTPANLPRVAAGDLHYVGAFKLPSVWSAANPDATFSYNDDGLAFNPANHSLLVKSHVYGQLIAEMSIPAPVNSTDPDALNSAAFLQGFADLTEGHLNPQNIANGMRIGGLLVYGGRLIGAEWAYYDGASEQDRSHFTSALNFATTGDYRGMYAVGDLFPAFVGGHMTAIPAEWQAAFGGHALTGHCCTSIIGHQSLGPSASVFNPEDLGVLDPVPAHTVVNYPIDHPTLGVWGTGPANPLYNMSTTITGVVFPAGTRSVVFFGATGLGPSCYGEGTADASLAGQPTPDGSIWCYDPDNSSKGTHAYPYTPYLWMYDANDLVAVRSGARNPWDVQPYWHGALNLPVPADALNGAVYDPGTQRLYVEQACAVGDCEPLFHILQLTTADEIFADRFE
jgi:hypothetical protein